MEFHPWNLFNFCKYLWSSSPIKMVTDQKTLPISHHTTFKLLEFLFGFKMTCQNSLHIVKLITAKVLKLLFWKFHICLWGHYGTLSHWLKYITPLWSCASKAWNVWLPFLRFFPIQSMRAIVSSANQYCLMKKAKPACIVIFFHS